MTQLSYPLPEAALVLIRHDIRNLAAFDVGDHPKIEVCQALGAAIGNLEMLLKHIDSLGDDSCAEIAYRAIACEKAHQQWSADETNESAWKAYIAHKESLAVAINDYAVLNSKP